MAFAAFTEWGDLLLSSSKQPRLAQMGIEPGASRSERPAVAGRSPTMKPMPSWSVSSAPVEEK